MQTAKNQFQKIIGSQITINGNHPQDIHVHNEKLYSRVLFHGTLGLGEAYMDGWWDCKALDQFFTAILTADLLNKVRYAPFGILCAVKQKLFNLQKPSKAFEVGKEHYDLGNDLYQAMLDQRMVYTCGYWKNAKTLDEAQEAKMDLVCRKLQLKPGMRVLDTGCGWGSFAKFAAEKYDVAVVGVTVSREQVDFAKQNCKGLSVDIRLQDYRDVNEKFDRVAGIGLLEHVGPKNYKTYMKMVHRCLKNDGLFLLHTIGGSKFLVDPWLEKYIFKNGILPTQPQVVTAAKDLFDIVDLHEFGQYYDLTLMAWFKNFEQNWDKIQRKYNQRFYRMWRFYLLFCAGLFRTRLVKLWQFVLTKEGASSYESIR